MKSLSIKLRNSIGVIIAVLLCLFTTNSARAQLLNFDFTLIGDPNDSTVAGSITGEILGLQNNGTSTPTDIIITSAPAGLDIPTLSYSLKDHGWSFAEPITNKITVSNGVITSETHFEVTLGSSSFFDLNAPLTLGNGVLVGYLNGFQYQSNYIANFDGISGVTYDEVAVPEPSTWAMLLGGLGVLIFWRLRTRGAR